MAAPDQGHSGDRRLMSAWSIRVPLLPDESVSSWLARSAIAQGCDPLALTGALWPRWRIWSTDPDRGIESERLRVLTQASGIPADEFVRASLRPVIEAAAGRHLVDRSAWPWLLALGSRNRKRRGGIQFCQACLSEDRAPYFRAHWRLTWHVGCPKHGLQLSDRCPSCGSPVEPHRLEAHDGSLATCATCKVTLGHGSADPARSGAMALQQAADSALEVKQAAYGDRQMPVSDWFGLIRHFVGLIRRANAHPESGLARAIRSLAVDLDAIRIVSPGLPVELLSVPERALLMQGAWQMVNAGEHELLQVARDAGLSSAAIRDSDGAPPNALRLMSAPLPGTPPTKATRAAITRPRSKRSVQIAWSHLQRRLRSALR